jgi:hypothetical protein
MGGKRTAFRLDPTAASATPFLGIAKRNRVEDGEVRDLLVTKPPLPPDEPLSPELVLVLPPEERAQALAALGPPVWPMPRLRVVARPTAVEQPPPLPAIKPPLPSIKRLVAARLVSLGVIFVAATVITLALSLVAHALRTP